MKIEQTAGVVFIATASWLVCAAAYATGAFFPFGLSFLDFLTLNDIVFGRSIVPLVISLAFIPAAFVYIKILFPLARKNLFIT